MSMRTIVEFNHDKTHTLGDSFLATLDLYLSSGDMRFAVDLSRYGVTVISTNHHSANEIDKCRAALSPSGGK